MARKKANNRMLVILLALIAVVCVALWYADKVEREGKAAAAAEQPADEAAEAAAATLAGEGAEAPDFTVEMIDGSKVALSELRGKVVLLNFWATWCPPCREELSHVQQQVIDRFAGEEFVFLPISRGEERAAGRGLPRPKRATPSRWGSTRTRRSTSAMRPVSSRATF